MWPPKKKKNILCHTTVISQIQLCQVRRGQTPTICFYCLPEYAALPWVSGWSRFITASPRRLIITYYSATKLKRSELKSSIKNLFVMSNVFKNTRYLWYYLRRSIFESHGFYLLSQCEVLICPQPFVGHHDAVAFQWKAASESTGFFLGAVCQQTMLRL